MSLSMEIYQDDGILIEPEFREIIKRVCDECTRAYSESLCAGVYLTDDSGIREKNLLYRKIDSATDVLSFPMLDSSNGKLNYTELDEDKENGCIMLGDLVISMEKVESQAEDYGHSVERELAFLACHGMLHLIGYDHMNPADETGMLQMQENILESLGYIR
jgi:probable rRNA maturation factor